MTLIKIPVSVDGHILQTELAVEPNEKKLGLMHRSNLASNSGMLFIYEKPTTLRFWMKDTYFPLTVAFINDHLYIVHMEDMAPRTTRPHQCPSPVRYALEANPSWFNTRGITIGSTVHFDLPS